MAPHPDYGPAIKSTNIYLAAKIGDLEEVKKLIGSSKEKDNLDRPVMTEEWGQTFTPLKIAAKNGYLNIVKYLLSQGADINRVRYLFFAGRTGYFSALALAAYAGRTNIVEYLLRQGAKIASLDVELAKTDEIENKIIKEYAKRKKIERRCRE